jgi:hypothetical protein
MRESADGLPLSTDHVVIRPRSSFTSNDTTECGFAHANLFTTAFSSVMVVGSYAAVE